MSVQRPDPVRDAATVQEATDRLLGALDALDPAAAGEPSMLAGWTRGHVITHLANNADALVNLLTWARTGTETPMYTSREARDKGIAEGAGRPLAEQITGLRAAAERFAAAVDAMPEQAWAAQVRVGVGGQVIPAAEVPERRLTEVNLHHVDLGIGLDCSGLPADYTARELAAQLEGLAGREGIAAVRLRDSGTGETWVLGAAERPELTVTGSAGALLGWVSGRSDGTGLTVDPEAPLPVLPPLG